MGAGVHVILHETHRVLALLASLLEKEGANSVRPSEAKCEAMATYWGDGVNSLPTCPLIAAFIFLLMSI